MASKRIRFTFPEGLITEPIVWQIGHEFKVVTNIRMADVDENVGWVILELTGDESEIERSIEWAQSKGVRVDPITGDVIEG
jgi:L-aspartate semialdehyde sulfurtransferase ferredoxin